MWYNVHSGDRMKMACIMVLMQLCQKQEMAWNMCCRMIRRQKLPTIMNVSKEREEQSRIHRGAHAHWEGTMERRAHGSSVGTHIGVSVPAVACISYYKALLGASLDLTPSRVYLCLISKQSSTREKSTWLIRQYSHWTHQLMWLGACQFFFSLKGCNFYFYLNKCHQTCFSTHSL